MPMRRKLIPECFSRTSMLQTNHPSIAAELLSAVDPASRCLVVRIRPPATGMNEWLAGSVAAIAAPLADISAHAGLDGLANALTTQGGHQWNSRIRELRLFSSLRPGDVVVAGDDAGVVFAVGLVESGYTAEPTAKFRHRIGVRWWTGTLPKKSGGSPGWRFQEICEVRRDIIESLMMEESRTETLPEPSFPDLFARITSAGLRLPEAVVRRYHIALKSRGFVILAGVSGTGKTWLAELYAHHSGARHLVVPVAPNWTSNEDLLGYLNPLDGAFHATAFSLFLDEAARDWREAREQGRTGRPFHLILDEMNLARVEHYFARFLSAMELRKRSSSGEVEIEVAPGRSVMLPPNLLFVGTVNVDETTHGFADKVFDRAQLIELGSPREALMQHLGNSAHSARLMAVWDAVAHVAPFAFRVLDDIGAYIRRSSELGVAWPEALDEQVLQKILPKIKGNDSRVGDALMRLMEACGDDLPLSRDRARLIYEGYQAHGFVSFF